MNNFSEDDFKRESIISYLSTLSKDSIDSELSIILDQSKYHSDSFGYQIENNRRETLLNEQSKEKASFSDQFLFFGPLILCLILLISGIVVFIIVEQRNNKNQNKEIKFNYTFNLTPNESSIPILCPFVGKSQFIESEFAFNELKCGFNRSSVIQMYYLDDPRPIKPGENLTMRDVLIPPIVQLHNEFLSKINTKSFLLILIDPDVMPTIIGPHIILHWIRYFSSSLEDEEDICSYKLQNVGHRYTVQEIILLYATNSSQMMIRAKTFCNQWYDWFKLIEYVTFVKLKLIASTNFFIPYVKTSDNYDD